MYVCKKEEFIITSYQKRYENHSNELWQIGVANS